MTLQPAQDGDEAPLMTTHTGIDHPADEEVAEYLLAGATVRPDTPTGQALLAQAYLEHERPMCRCTPDGTAMYIARIGTRFIVKRMPDSGSLHSTRCGSYAPEEASGLGHALGDAIRIDPESGQTTLRLGFRLSVGERAAPDTSGPPTIADNVTTNGKRLSLRDLLDYLWYESDLVAWSPGMAGRRHWGLVAWLLRQAAGTTRAKGYPLTERLYIPEPFRVDRKAEIAARRLNRWQKAAARPGRVQQLMVLVAELKAIEPARYGHQMVLKHMPDAPLFLDEQLHRKLTRRFAREIDLWNADQHGHLIVIATFVVGRGGSAMAEELALMPATAQWLPYDDAYAKLLLETLVDQHRRFRTTLRFTLPSAVELPTAILTDRTEPTRLYVRDDSTGEDNPAPDREWVWHVDEPLPPLPRRD